MENTIELPAYLTVLGRTSAVSRMVHDTAMKENLPVETLWGIADGYIVVGWHIMDLERTKTVVLRVITNDISDPIQIYRAYRVAQQMKIVSQAGLGDIMRAFHANEVEGGHEAETRLLRDVGPRKFDEIRTAIDPQFERNLNTIVDANVPIYLGGIFAEVDAGRIIPTAGLRSFGIMPKPEREAADQRLTAAITRWMPHFEAFAEQFGHGPACIEVMVSGATAARWKGVEDVSLHVGLGILSHHERHRRGLSGVLGNIAGRLGAALGMIAMVLGRPAGSPDEDITQIAAFLAERFPGADAFQYACALQDYWSRLPSIPVDRSI